LKKIDKNLVSTQKRIWRYSPNINKYKNTKTTFILKKYAIIQAPTKVIIKSMIAKSYTRMECIPSLGTPRISLYWAKIHIL
jgi:hypothetical protein